MSSSNSPTKRKVKGEAAAAAKEEEEGPAANAIPTIQAEPITPPPTVKEVITPTTEGEGELLSHADLLQKARKDRAQKEANRRLNRVHEYEMQIKVQQVRQPNVPIRDANGKTWEDYHDLFWEAKRGIIFKDDPLGLNAHLAKVLGEERLVAWQNEREVS